MERDKTREIFIGEKNNLHCAEGTTKTWARLFAAPKSSPLSEN